MEDEPVDWPPVLRTFHLAGGLRFVEIGPGKAILGPLAAADVSIRYESYSGVAGTIAQRLGLPILGCEFFRDELEVENLFPAAWRAVMPRRQNEWPTQIAEINWSGLSNVARRRSDPHLYLIAGAITSQYRFAAVRLQELSELYSDRLNSLLKTNDKLAEDQLFSGGFTDRLFSSIHAAFFEIATLKDYLAEYIGQQIYQDPMIDSFKKLNDLLLKAPRGGALEDEILSISGNGGWLKDFSDRRNTFAHRMPFDRLSGSGAFHVKRHVSPNSIAMWLLFVPMPAAVSPNFKKGFSLPADDDSFTRAAVEAFKSSKSQPDTLEYLFDIFAKLTDFGNRLRTTFPHEPEMTSLSEADIVSLSVGPDK